MTLGSASREVFKADCQVSPALIFDNQSGPLSYDVVPDGKILLVVYGPFIGRKPIKVVLNWAALLPSAARH
jgi:hypothetical protein